jgi:hypothetical protein
MVDRRQTADQGIQNSLRGRAVPLAVAHSGAQRQSVRSDDRGTGDVAAAIVGRERGHMGTALAARAMDRVAAADANDGR